MTMKRERFGIACGFEGQERLVLGYVVGEFGIDRDRTVRKGITDWTVTHLRTGCQVVGGFHLLEEAVRFCEALTRLGGRSWQRGTFAKPFSVAKGKAHDALIAAWQEIGREAPVLRSVL